jgi:hypothetical protein
MRAEAQRRNLTMIEVQKEQWQLRTSKAYKGEYVELAGEKEGTFKWVQAEGPKEKPKPTEPAAPPAP